jgi:hypothetical protein
MNAQQRSVLDRFSADALVQYGARLQGLYAFDYLGEDDEPDDDEISVDIDVAVVLADGNWRFLEEKKRLVEVTFKILLDSGTYIRAWPLPVSAWHDPSTYSNPSLVELIKQHSETIMEAV